MEGVLSKGVLSEGVLPKGVLSGGGFVRAPTFTLAYIHQYAFHQYATMLRACDTHSDTHLHTYIQVDRR